MSIYETLRLNPPVNKEKNLKLNAYNSLIWNVLTISHKCTWVTLNSEFHNTKLNIILCFADTTVQTLAVVLIKEVKIQHHKS